jgi:hypothetical protein
MISASVRIFVLLANCFSPSGAASAARETVPGAMKSALVYPNGAIEFNLISHLFRIRAVAAKLSLQAFVIHDFFLGPANRGQTVPAC